MLPAKKTIYLLLILFLFEIFSCTTNYRQNKNEKFYLLKNMGNSLFLAGKPREALPYLLKAEKIDPSNPDIQRELALVYQDIKQYDLAIVHYKEAIELKPDFSEAYNDLGVSYSQQGRLDWAMDCFNKAVQNILYTTPHFAYHNMGLIHIKKNDIEKAIHYYQKAIELEPDYSAAYFDMGRAYELSGRYNDAESTYKKIMEIIPSSLIPHLELARVYKKTGQMEKSVDKLNFIIGTDPRSTVAREALKMLEVIRSESR